MADLHKLKVVELKKMLKDNNLPVTGTKPELIMRLEALNGAKDTDILKEKVEIIDADILLEEDTTVSSTIASVPIIPQLPKIEKITMVTKPSPNGIEERIKRFGPVSGDAQKTLREQRFNNGLQSTTKLNKKTNVEEAMKVRSERFSKDEASNKTVTSNGSDVLAKRANRFGINATKTSTATFNASQIKSNTTTVAGPEAEAKLKRAERFKINNPTSSITSSNIKDSSILKRKERFGVIVGPTDFSEEKRSKRAERFGIN